MFKKTCFYGAAALVLNLAAIPAQAQTTLSNDTTEFLSGDIAPIKGPTGNQISADDGVSYAPADPNKPRWYDDNGIPFSDKYYEMEASGVTMALQRGADLPPGHFVLSMSAVKTFSSCVKIVNPRYATSFDDNGTMTISMGKFIVDARDMPRYAHYECNGTPQRASVNVNMSKELLQDNNVKKIKLKTGQSSENYTVKITNDFIQLLPETRRNPKDINNRFRPMQASGVENALKLWFYPENTVILSADGSGKDLTLEKSLMDLARSKGLTPLTETMPEHASFRKQANHYYFIDKQGRYKAGNGTLFDYIQADAMRYGLEADEPIKKNVAVFIRKPGIYD